jgi:hypothetical protein
MTENDNLIVLKSAYDKTPGMEYKIAPCAMPNGMMPSCVRKVDSNGDLILSEADKKDYSKGAVFIGENEYIVVKHGSTFDLTDPLQAAQWECIKNSKIIAKERTARDSNGALIIDGGKPIVDQYQNAKGRYGLAELYIERPGKTAQYKNDIRKLILKAQNLVNEDNQAHRIMICKLFEKNMENAHPSDVEDYLMTQAEKYPDKIIKYYNTEEAAVRLLLIMARDKKILQQRQDGLYYADIKLGSNLDLAVEMLKHNDEIKNAIKIEAYPELQKKTTKSKEE